MTAKILNIKGSQTLPDMFGDQLDPLSYLLHVYMYIGTCSYIVNFFSR